MDHIDDMDQLREGIGLQAYGQRDPVVEYRMAGFEMFNDMTKAIQEETTGALFHVQVEQKIEREEAPKITGTNKDAEVEKKPYVRKGAKVGRMILAHVEVVRSIRTAAEGINKEFFIND